MVLIHIIVQVVNSKTLCLGMIGMLFKNGFSFVVFVTNVNTQINSIKQGRLTWFLFSRIT